MTVTSSELSSVKRELLAARLRGALGRAGGGIPPRPRSADVPLAPVQYGLWVVDQFLDDNALYSVHRDLWLSGRLDTDALRRAVDELVARHEILRTRYAGDTDPVQLIAPPRPGRLDLVDLSGLPADERVGRAEELAVAELRRPFDLDEGPVFRATLFRLADDEHLLLLNMHHLVSDGWSCAVLGQELAELYSASVTGRPVRLPALTVQYADYAHWQADRMAGPVGRAQLDHWRRVFDGIAPVLRLPTDRPHPIRPSYRADRLSRTLSPSTTERVRAMARDRGVTVFGLVLAAFEVVLSRCSGQESFAVGSLTSGREQTETEHLMGLFANTVAIPADLSGDPTFGELLDRTRGAVLGALGNADVSFDDVVSAVAPEREVGRNPLFQVLFQFIEVSEEQWGFHGLDVRLGDSHHDLGKLDLTLYGINRADTLELQLEYAVDLFDEPTAARYLDRVLAALDRVVADPAIRLSDVDVLTAGERSLVLHGWNDTAFDVPRVPLGELFEAAAARTPAAPAIVGVDGAVTTYAELNTAANRLAHELRGLGVRSESVVGVCVGSGVDMFVALLGVVKSGAAYVPLDPDHPADRLAFVVADTAAEVVVTQHALAARLPDGVPRLVFVEDGRSGESAVNPVPVSTADSLVYVMYTSGSTGRPKGVMISHHGLINYLWWAIDGYGVSGEHGAPMLGSIAVDLSVPNFFLPLITGKDVTLLPPDRSLSALAELLTAPGDFSLLKLTPGHLDVLRANVSDSRVDSVRTFVVGADEVRPETVAAWRQVAPDARIIDEYGPTETVVGCSTYLIDEDFDPSVPVSIGKPIGNIQMYVLDDALAPLPIGAVGELCIGGFGVARGYWMRPGLTAEKFVPNPHGAPGDRMYRTGDLARFRSDGNLDFLGRFDHQVKIRGYRVELGEIEARLLLHPDVSEAVVVAREDTPGHKRLAGYLVAGREVTTTDLRAHLAAALPEHMVPATLTVLERMPLTQAGKVDRAALPRPDAEVLAVPVAARTDTERLLAGIWADVLGVDVVGVHDDFFALGGDSIHAIRTASRATAAGISLTVRDVFERRTVAGLAGIGSNAQQARSIPRRSNGAVVPLSPVQHALWLVDQFLDDNSVYSVPKGVWLRGPLDLAALRQAVEEVVRRHEILRTTFVGSPTPRQVVAEPGAVELTVVEVHGDHDRALELARQEASTPFDLAIGPVIRVSVFRVGPAEHLLVLNLHHLVLDDWSVLTAEITELYTAAVAGRAAVLPELPIQYADYAGWQAERLAGGLREEQLAWWRSVLGGVQPVLRLPTDRPHPPRPTYRSGIVAREVPVALARRVRDLVRGRDVTMFGLLLAAFEVVLSRCSGQESFAVGSLTSGRERAETEHLLGLFANTVAIPADLSGDPTFAELLDRTRGSVLGALGNADVSFDDVVSVVAPERELGRNPLFQVLFQLADAADADWCLPGIDVTPADLYNHRGKLDLTLYGVDRPDLLELQLEYAVDLFDETTAARYLDRVVAVLDRVVADPAVRLSDVDVLTANERHLVLHGWNDTALAVPRTTLGELFEAAVTRTPEAPAIVGVDGAITTYAELNAAANRLAHGLRGLGVGSESIVGVCVESGVDMFVALLGVVKSGAAYVPLDPDHPADRIAFVLADTGAQVVVTQQALAGRLPAGTARLVFVDDDRTAESDVNPVPVSTADSLVYVMYTSGSTGRPKGVMISHHGLINYLWWAIDGYGVAGEHGAPMLGSIAVDLSVPNFFLPLITGKDVTLLPPDRSLSALADLLSAPGDFSLLKLTPGHLDVLRSNLSDVDTIDSVRTYVVGADEVRPETVAAWRQVAPGARIIDEYGPTETVVGCSTYLIGDDFDPSVPVSIGKPIGNIQMYVLNERLDPVPVGAVGELCIGGFGVARGYWKRAGLTAEKFVPNPYGAPGDRMYRTGDLARFRADGNLEFLGRFDHQVKIRGYRVELGEIEARLLLHPDVSEAVVIAREDTPGHKRLAGYVVSAAGGVADPAELRMHVAAALPEHMVPATVIVLARMPLTQAGKVDRSALPRPDAEPSTMTVAPRTDTERVLAGIWAELLGVDSIGIHDDFFALGGDSILAVRIVARLRDSGTACTVRQLFEHRTIATLAEQVTDTSTEAAGVIEERGPARLPHSGLDADTLARVLSEHPGEEFADIYPLTPLQAGMLVESLAAGGSDPYFRQWAFDLDGPLDVSVLTRSWQHVTDRHPVLRTRFAWEGLPHPVQLVSRTFTVPVDRWDGRTIPDADRNAWVERLVADERELGIELDTAPPSRLLLIRTGELRHRLVWTTHHILLDGWSTAAVLDEVFATYQSLVTERRQPSLPDVVPFAAYVRRPLGDTDSAGYWAKTFDGRTTPTPAPGRRRTDEPGGSALVAATLDDAFVAELTAAARRHRVTVSTISQAAWALLAHAHTGEPDITFGLTVNGRSADLAGIDRIVGLLMNTVPVRIAVDDTAAIGDWLRHLHDEHLRREPHEHCALTDIQRWAGFRPGQQLFTTRFVFERASDEAPAQGGLAVTDVSTAIGESEYPLVLSIYFGLGGQVQVRYDRSDGDPDGADRLLDEYLTVLRALAAADPADPVHALPVPDIGAAAEWSTGDLPEDRPATSSGPVAPRTPEERVLAEIWAEVLGITEIGVHQDFFDLGGDSIMVFGVVTAARRAGITRTVRQALTHRTIAGLAALEQPATPAVPGLVDPAAPAPLTPTFRRFLDRPIHHDHHNQAMLLDWRTPPDHAWLATALRELVVRHEALRYRLTSAGWDVDEDAGPGPLRVVELSDAADLDAAMHLVADELHAGMDLATGPLFAAALFTGDSITRLLLVAHHIAVDAVSWTILLDDLAELYRDPNAPRPDGGTSYRQWAHLLGRHTATDRFVEDAAYWLPRRPAPARLPVDDPDGTDLEADAVTVCTSLSIDDTETLLRSAPATLGCRVDELLVVGVAGALARWAGGDQVLLDVEGHGREPIIDGADLGRTVGWFTSVHPLWLHLPDGGTRRRAAAVRDQIRAVPDHGVGYGLARYLHPSLGRELAARPAAEVICTHHGRRTEPTAGAEQVPFTVYAAAPGATRHLDTRRSHPLAVDTMIAGGRVEIRWTYSGKRYREDTIAGLAADCLAELRTLAALSREPATPRSETDPSVLAERLVPYGPALLLPMARNRVPGLSVARLEGGEVVAAWGHGDTGGPDPAPVTASTLFPACSVSKFVTALGVLRLVQDGRLDLDRDINEQLLSWRLPAGDGLTGPVTLRQVMGHIGGLSEFRHPGYRRGAVVPTLPEILSGTRPANTPAVRRERPAGGEFRYSCGNFSVIQQLVVDVAGLPFAEAMRELVLDPLGMSGSGFEQDLPEHRPPGAVAHGHDADGHPIAGGWWVFPEQASSGFWCTATDLAKISGEVVRAAAGDGSVFLQREMATEMVTPLTESYGLGTAVSRGAGTHWFGHPGDKKSHQCFTATDLHTGDGLVVLANIGGDAPLTANLLHDLGVRVRYLIG